ncbi:DNA repair protein RecN [Notoacmeibacter ruber]|uniref:DNA repair protein RecN n=1 Tax=Notoacmeibacter ruber TaxID=2670375 RepID=A0A3L7JCY2_9HYPH|nr:DNA repair protein RecN [Notoacmeibacter ruber]RLQ88175.1 DNA repair protein RecN [Notoacmeibacter ruber]
MLASLSIRDIVLIERLDLDLSDGLSVLTGETGAGKSILLDALSLALGARGDAGLVRAGQSQGQVTAVFDIPAGHPARQVLRDNELEDDGDIILRRVQTADGRTRVFVNDRPSSVALMRRLGAELVEIHGQHDDRALVDQAAHLLLLDAFGGLVGEVQSLGRIHAAWRKAEHELSAHRAKIEEAAREADYLRASSEELSELDPQPGEEEDLAIRRTNMQKAEKIAVEIADTQEVLSDPNAPMSQLAGLMRRLERKSQDEPELLSGIVSALDEAMIALDAVQAGVDEAQRAAEFDPHDLEATEERLFALRAASRKFGVSVDDLPELRDRMVSDLADIDAGEERLAAMEKAVAEAEAEYDATASVLSEKRKAAADALSNAVMAELPALKLDRARFFVHFESDGSNRAADGIDSAEFWVQTNPGTNGGPMMKVASGGELSRFLLALKVALADRGSAPTLVFDEIDTGVGGAVADAIGARLARLAENVQVLSVTHAPQVAAQAKHHFLIAKSGEDRMATSVSLMERRERSEEIARMLSGASVTDEARAAAEKLLHATQAG